MDPEVITVEIGHQRYEDLIGRIRRDADLLAALWADAETRLEESPGKRWAVVAVDGEPVAWAAARVTTIDGVLTLVCSDNYEARGVGRDRGLYQVAYRVRHATIVAPSPLPGVTYLYRQPRPLHEADGWQLTGVHGVSTDAGEPHEWWQLRRAPTP